MIDNISIIRIEQIAPFPYDLIGPAIRKYPAAELVWMQEEPKNQGNTAAATAIQELQLTDCGFVCLFVGAWAYIKPRFDTVLREYGIGRKSIRYIGRKPSASAATGSYKVHTQEQKEIIDLALKL
jgi:2-oxoglutarate dehydrogenase E1 component